MSAAVPFWDHDLLGPWDLSTKGWCALRSSLSRKADPWHFLWLLLESLGGSSKMGKPLHGNGFCRAEGVGSYSFCDVNKSWWRFSFAVLLAVHGIFNSPGWIPCGMLLLGCLHMGDSWELHLGERGESKMSPALWKTVKHHTHVLFVADSQRTGTSYKHWLKTFSVDKYCQFLLLKHFRSCRAPGLWNTLSYRHIENDCFWPIKFTTQQINDRWSAFYRWKSSSSRGHYLKTQGFAVSLDTKQGLWSFPKLWALTSISKSQAGVTFWFRGQLAGDGGLSERFTIKVP